MKTSSWMIIAGYCCLCFVIAPVFAAEGLAKTVSPVIRVTMKNRLAYKPDHITIHQGETIEWKNTSVLVHTVTDMPALASRKGDAVLPKGAKAFNSPKLAPGASFHHTFTVPGHYRYFCIPHESAGMVGDITVLE